MQWFLKITDFAEDLLECLRGLKNWPEKVKTMQERWIGKSEGVIIEFEIISEAMAKLAGGYILFISKNMEKSATGKALRTTNIRPQDTINWKVHFTVCDKYNSVEELENKIEKQEKSAKHEWG